MLLQDRRVADNAGEDVIGQVRGRLTTVSHQGNPAQIPTPTPALLESRPWALTHVGEKLGKHSEKEGKTARLLWATAGQLLKWFGADPEPYPRCRPRSNENTGPRKASYRDAPSSRKVHITQTPLITGLGRQKGVFVIQWGIIRP